MSIDVEKTMRHYSAMKELRNSYDSHWEELADWFSPRRLRTMEKRTDNPSERGRKMNQRLIDPTPRFAARTLGAGMHAGSTNPSTPWFKLVTPDTELMEFPAVSEWLYFVEQQMRAVFDRSNLYAVLPQVYSDGGVFGTSPLTILEHDTRVVNFVPSPIGSYCLGTDYDGTVVSKYCEYQQTSEQLVSQFGINNVSARIRTEVENGQKNSYHRVLHVIEPRTKRKYGAFDAGNMAWRSTYIEMDGERKVMRDSGFEDNPLAALRWETAEITDAYGFSPGMDALGCSKALQIQTKQKGKAIDKLVDPPMVGDAELQAKPTTLLPGGVTYAGFTPTGSQPKFTPAYVIKPELQHMLADIQDLRRLIEMAMYTDLFLAITRADPRNATAEEIAARYQEKILLLGPVLQHHQNGIAQPIIDRTFYVMMRRGMLPPPPRELEGVDLKVELTGLLPQALKAVSATSIERFVGFVTTAAKMQADSGEVPNAFDKIDVDQAIDEYGIAIGVPPTLIRSDDDVAQIREQRKQEAQAQAAAAAAQPVAQMAKAAKDLSETQVGGESALDQLAGVT